LCCAAGLQTVAYAGLNAVPADHTVLQVLSFTIGSIVSSIQVSCSNSRALCAMSVTLTFRLENWSAQAFMGEVYASFVFISVLFGTVVDKR